MMAVSAKQNPVYIQLNRDVRDARATVQFNHVAIQNRQRDALSVSNVELDELVARWQDAPLSLLCYDYIGSWQLNVHHVSRAHSLEDCVDVNKVIMSFIEVIASSLRDLRELKTNVQRQFANR